MCLQVYKCIHLDICDMCTMCANMWTIVNWNRKHCTTLKLKNVKQRKACVQICVQICVQMYKLVILPCTPPSSSPKWPNSKRCENVYKGMKTFPGKNVSQLCRDVLLCSGAPPKWPNSKRCHPPNVLSISTSSYLLSHQHQHFPMFIFEREPREMWKYEDK